MKTIRFSFAKSLATAALFALTLAGTAAHAAIPNLTNHTFAFTRRLTLTPYGPSTSADSFLMVGLPTGPGTFTGRYYNSGNPNPITTQITVTEPQPGRYWMRVIWGNIMGTTTYEGPLSVTDYYNDGIDIIDFFTGTMTVNSLMFSGGVLTYYTDTPLPFCATGKKF